MKQDVGGQDVGGQDVDGQQSADLVWVVKDQYLVHAAVDKDALRIRTR